MAIRVLFRKFLLLTVATNNSLCFFAEGLRKAFLATRAAKSVSRRPTSQFSSLSMDMDYPPMEQSSRIKINSNVFSDSYSSMKSFRMPLAVDRENAVRRAEEEVAMPWSISIQPDSPLLYMSFWKWQLEFMKNELTNLSVIPLDEKFTYNENQKKNARIVSLCFSSDEYRKIRMTYYDAGDGCQVFNSLWYPDAKYNLPVLGIDLLAFGRKKHLAVVDFQPIHDQEHMHDLTYEHLLAPIKSSYPTLKGKMSSKFYDETKFFSKEMLFARFESESVVQDELIHAFQKYVQMHVKLVKDCPEKKSIQDRQAILERHIAYDTYSAERDPAVGLFATMFGKEWANDFVNDFLFSFSGKSGKDLIGCPAVEAQRNPQISSPLPATIFR